MKFSKIILILIFGLAISLRFFKVYDLAYFMIDEERDAFVMRWIWEDKHLTLVGNSVPGGLYLTPIYYYISLPFWVLSGGHPLGWAITASFLGILLVWLVYKVGRELFDQKVAFLSTTFYATSYLNVIQNRIFWPLMMPPLTALLTYFSLSKILKGKKKYFLLLFLALTIGIGYDSSVFSLFFLSALILFLNKVSVKNKYFLMGITLLVLAHLPLVIFDFRHDYMLTRAFLKFFQFSVSGQPKVNQALGIFRHFPLTFSRLIYTGGQHDIAAQINPCPQYFSLRIKDLSLPALTLAMLALIFFVFSLFFSSKYQKSKRLLFLHGIMVILGIFLFNLFYPAYVHEWFFYVYFPAFFYILGLFFNFLWRRKINQVVVLAILILIFLNVFAFLKGNNRSGLRAKIRAVDFAIKRVGKEPFFLDSLGSCFSFAGYRYLFWLRRAEPARSFMDAVYGDWFYPSPKGKAPKLGVVMVNPADQETEEFYQKYNNYLKNTLARRKFGQIEVLIVKGN